MDFARGRSLTQRLHVWLYGIYLGLEVAGACGVRVTECGCSPMSTWSSAATEVKAFWPKSDEAQTSSLIQDVPRDVRIHDPFDTVQLGERLQSMPFVPSFMHKLDDSHSPPYMQYAIYAVLLYSPLYAFKSKGSPISIASLRLPWPRLGGRRAVRTARRTKWPSGLRRLVARGLRVGVSLLSILGDGAKSVML